MLYERWRQVAQQHARETAVIEFPSGRKVTFAELVRQVEAAEIPAGAVLFPQGHDIQFVRTVLVGWRNGRTVCPLEPGWAAPAIGDPPKNFAHLKLTSATTGPARMIGLTEQQLMADADNIVATMGLQREWPNVAFISLAHSYGFSNLVLPLALFGIPLVLAAPPLPEVLRQVTRDLRHFTLPAVPALWQAWHEAGALPGNLRLAISAGAPLPL